MQVAHLIADERFTANTATLTGRSEDSVKRDVSRGTKITPEAKAALAGTPLADNGAHVVRANVSEADLEVMFARRKVLHQQKYPETIHGAIGNGRAEKSCQSDHSTSRFATETAAVTGMSESTVRKMTSRGEKIAPAARKLLDTLPKGFNTKARRDSVKSVAVMVPDKIKADDGKEYAVKTLDEEATAAVQVHEKFGNVSAIAETSLSRQALFDLAAKSTPEPVVAEVVERVADGETFEVVKQGGLPLELSATSSL